MARVGTAGTARRRTGRAREIAEAAAALRRALEAHARPLGEFDPTRYFRTTEPLEFLNVRTPVVRALARQVAREHRDIWTLDEAEAFSERLVRQAPLELKGAAIEALACRRRELGPHALGLFKGWLEDNLAANWATTDTLCGSLISPLLIAYPGLIGQVTGWTTHPNLWVRRASAVSLVRLAARGTALEAAYAVATALRGDDEDLIQKAAGWLLREAGATDPDRLERYLRANGATIPRTTVRYAIERFPPAKRRDLLDATRPARPSHRRAGTAPRISKSRNR